MLICVRVHICLFVMASVAFVERLANPGRRGAGMHLIKQPHVIFEEESSPSPSPESNPRLHGRNGAVVNDLFDAGKMTMLYFILA